MFVGHFAVAFVSKRLELKLSLGTLTAAAMFPDLLWPIFTIAGIEYQTPVMANNSFNAPISHSLLTVVIWAALFSGTYFLWRRFRDHQSYTRASVILFATVLSHWFLDFLSHKHVLVPGAQSYLGLELWQSFSATLIVEGGFWLLAIILYVRATRARNRAGLYVFWMVVAFLTLVWITNIRKGPPPPGAVIGSLIFFLLMVGWAYWMNRVRPVQA